MSYYIAVMVSNTAKPIGWVADGFDKLLQIGDCRNHLAAAEFTDVAQANQVAMTLSATHRSYRFLVQSFT